MDYTEIQNAILDGTLDNKLDMLQDDIQLRRKVLGAKRAHAAYQLPAGTRVKLVNVSPKKANGATGVITYDTHNGDIGIVLDYSITPRLYGGHTYTWPASCYEKIENPYDALAGDEADA